MARRHYRGLIWHGRARHAGGAPELVEETQTSTPPEPTRHHNSIKLWILLPLRADLFVTLQHEIPCIYNLRTK